MKKNVTYLHHFTLRGTIMSIKVQKVLDVYHYDMWVENGKGRYNIIYYADKLSPIIKQGYGLHFKGLRYETITENGCIVNTYHAKEIYE